MNSPLPSIFNRPPSKIENFDKRLDYSSEGIAMAMLLNCADLYKGETFHELYAPFFSGEYMKLLGVTDVDMSFEHLRSELQGEFMMQAFKQYQQAEEFVIKRDFGGSTNSQQYLGKWTRTLYSIKDGASSTMDTQKKGKIDLFDEKFMKLILKHGQVSENAVDIVYKSNLANTIEKHTRSRLPIFSQSALSGYLEFFSKKKGSMNESLVVSLIRVKVADLNDFTSFFYDLINEKLPRGACILSTDSQKYPLELLLLSSDNCSPGVEEQDETTFQKLFPKSSIPGTKEIRDANYRVQFDQVHSPRVCLTKTSTGDIQPGLSEYRQRKIAQNRIEEKFGLKKAA